MSIIGVGVFSFRVVSSDAWDDRLTRLAHVAGLICHSATDCK
jgi:hypothetical protein